MKRLLVLMLCLQAAASAYAVDNVFIEVGEGNNIDMARVGMQWKWDRTWRSDSDWPITGAWEVAVGGFRGDKPNDNDQTIADIGVTPVFRWAVRDGTELSPYFEWGFLGLHMISRAYAYNDRKLGSGFQFGHLLGVGLNFGERLQYGLGFRVQHMSNAGIVEPNQGINFNQLHLSYFF